MILLVQLGLLSSLVSYTLFQCVCGQEVSSNITVDTGYATYLGNFTAPFSVAFLGLRYAEPPLGDRRFRATVPLDTQALMQNKTVIDTTTYPDFCVQGSMGLGDAGGAGTEDCLKINVYRPINATSSSNLPVLVYIHGGGYVWGNPRNWPFDHWINQSPNVVIASVYYRLDSFGFLTHPSFSDPTNGDFNVGFIDQITALQWVHDHIASFGGDPEKVTINGQSAGAGSVQLHMIANEPLNLFRGAIIQSVERGPIPDIDQQVPLFNDFAAHVGCTSDSITDTLSCLRQAPTDVIARAQDAGQNFTGSPYNIWRPVVDGKIITGHPTQLLLSGQYKHIPVIAGSTSNETTQGPANLSANVLAEFPSLTSDDLLQFEQVYDPRQFSDPLSRSWNAIGEARTRCQRWVHEHAALVFTKAFSYRYNQPNPTQSAPGNTLHSADNWMMFLGTNVTFNGSTIFTGLNETETAFSEELIAYWLSFVRDLDPNTFKLPLSPVWPDFSTGMRIVLQENVQNTTQSAIFNELEPLEEAARCVFIASKSDHMQD